MYIGVYLMQVKHLTEYITLYIDKLLIRLKHAHIGCHMNNIFTGALSYADDIKLLCPSTCGINNMIDICCEYAKKYDITFNPTKTVCIKYVDKVELNEHVVMNGNISEWAANVRHLDDCDLKATINKKPPRKVYQWSKADWQLIKEQTVIFF